MGLHAADVNSSMEERVQSIHVTVHGSKQSLADYRSSADSPAAGVKCTMQIFTSATDGATSQSAVGVQNVLGGNRCSITKPIISVNSDAYSTKATCAASSGLIANNAPNNEMWDINKALSEQATLLSQTLTDERRETDIATTSARKAVYVETRNARIIDGNAPKSQISQPSHQFVPSVHTSKQDSNLHSKNIDLTSGSELKYVISPAGRKKTYPSSEQPPGGGLKNKTAAAVCLLSQHMKDTKQDVQAIELVDLSFMSKAKVQKASDMNVAEWNSNMNTPPTPALDINLNGLIPLKEGNKFFITSPITDDIPWLPAPCVKNAIKETWDNGSSSGKEHVSKKLIPDPLKDNGSGQEMEEKAIANGDKAATENITHTSNEKHQNKRKGSTMRQKRRKCCDRHKAKQSVRRVQFENDRLETDLKIFGDKLLDGGELEESRQEKRRRLFPRGMRRRPKCDGKCDICDDEEILLSDDEGKDDGLDLFTDLVRSILRCSFLHKRSDSESSTSSSSSSDSDFTDSESFCSGSSTSSSSGSSSSSSDTSSSSSSDSSDNDVEFNRRKQRRKKTKKKNK